MTALEMLTLLEEDRTFGGYFVDLHIVNNQVAGFYKTLVVKYKDCKGDDVSYLFPTTFVFRDGKIQISMVLGSVTRDFVLEKKIHGTGDGTELSTVTVSPHLYKLLIANNQKSEETHYLDVLKSFMLIIEDLNRMGFPFIRIAQDKQIENCEDMPYTSAFGYLAKKDESRISKEREKLEKVKKILEGNLHQIFTSFALDFDVYNRKGHTLEKYVELKELLGIRSGSITKEEAVQFDKFKSSKKDLYDKLMKRLDKRIIELYNNNQAPLNAGLPLSTYMFL